MFLGLLDRESAKDEECVSLNLDSQLLMLRFFVMYYIYVYIWAIPTYRVYQLYDSSK